MVIHTEQNFLTMFRDLNGWIGYTYSETKRKFDEIDNGEWFPAKYDRRNDFLCNTVPNK